MKSTEFCSAVIKSRRVHFACMKPSVAVHAKRGFCKEHAPAFETFYVYNIGNDGTVSKVLVFQQPGNNHTFHVVSPSDRTYGSTLWGSRWHRSLREAQNAPLKYARQAVRTAEEDLKRRKAELKKVEKAAR